ncbi:MAG: hypothetical protein ABI462_01005 [Ignavibacteria bacterium]
MKTLKVKKEKSALPTITLLNKSNIEQKPSAFPSPNELKKLAVSHGIIGDLTNMGPGFVLNANEPFQPRKANLIVPVNKFMSTQDSIKPYYYYFNQWPIAAEMIEAEWGKVTIHFNRGYLIQDGIAYIRVGGYTSPFMGDEYQISDGKNNWFVKAIHNGLKTIAYSNHKLFKSISKSRQIVVLH